MQSEGAVSKSGGAVTTKKTYIKPLRTIVEIDARYADQIRDLLNAAPTTKIVGGAA